MMMVMIKRHHRREGDEGVGGVAAVGEMREEREREAKTEEDTNRMSRVAYSVGGWADMSTLREA